MCRTPKLVEVGPHGEEEADLRDLPQEDAANLSLGENMAPTADGLESPTNTSRWSPPRLVLPCIPCQYPSSHWGLSFGLGGLCVTFGWGPMKIGI